MTDYTIPDSSNRDYWIKQFPDLADVFRPKTKSQQSLATPTPRKAKPKGPKKLDLTDKFLGYWKLAGNDLPQPEREYRFHETRNFRFDLAWVGLKLAVEFHGGMWVRGGHSRGKNQQRDFDKLNLAQEAGFTVLQFGTDHLESKRIAETLLAVRQAVEARMSA